jgi:hypothetical protein
MQNPAPPRRAETIQHIRRKPMTNASAPKAGASRFDSKERALARQSAAFNRRLKAAGIDRDYMPQDQDEFRYHLARMISIYRNRWHGCPELLCQRNRGCMAPSSRCSNVPRLPPQEAERRWRLARPGIVKLLKRVLDERGRPDD